MIIEALWLKIVQPSAILHRQQEVVNLTVGTLCVAALLSMCIVHAYRCIKWTYWCVPSGQIWRRAYGLLVLLLPIWCSSMSRVVSCLLIVQWATTLCSPFFCTFTLLVNLQHLSF